MADLPTLRQRLIDVIGMPTHRAAVAPRAPQAAKQASLPRGSGGGMAHVQRQRPKARTHDRTADKSASVGVMADALRRALHGRDETQPED